MTNTLTGAERFIAAWRQSTAEGNLYSPDDLATYIMGLAVVPGNGRQASTLATYLANNALFNVRDFGAKGDGVTNDTPAFNAAVTAAASVGAREIYVPDGVYVLTNSAGSPNAVVLGSGMVLRGRSRAGTQLNFQPTVDGICVQFTANGAINTNCGIRDISFYSPDTTHTKVAIEMVDVSTAFVEWVDISGAGTGTPSANYWSGGTGSIGIRTKGREKITFNEVKSVADIPQYIAANPNTSATAGEDMDHGCFENLYYVAKGNPCIKVADGLGVMNTVWKQAALVGGNGAAVINDTRVAPQIPSRGIRFENIRTEQGQTAGNYWINMAFTQPCQTLTFENVLLDATQSGFSINGVAQLVFDAVTVAGGAGKTSLLMAGAIGGATIDMRGCYWQPGSTFTPAGYNLVHAPAFDSAITVGPSSATYSAVITGSSVFAEKLVAFCAAFGVGLTVAATANDDQLQIIPNTAGLGATIRALNSAGSDYSELIEQFTTLALQYRTGVNTAAEAVRIGSDGKLVANLGIGVGGSASATTPGTVVKKVPIYDNATPPVLLGYLPVYSSIT